MLSIETVGLAVAVITSISAALFGNGVFKRRTEHTNQLAVQSYRQEETEKKVKELEQNQIKTNQDMALVKKDIEGFNQHVRKLEMIPEINAKLTTLERLINFMSAQLGWHEDPKE